VVVAGGWPSRSLRGLARHRAGLRGVPTAPRRHRPSLAEEPATCGPSGLRSPSELSLLPWSNLDLLSWDSSGGAETDRGFRRDPLRAPNPPPPTPAAQARPGDCHRASTPARIAARFGPEEPSSESCSVRVVSHHLDGFLRSEVAGLLHPAAGHGVRCVSGSRIPLLDPTGAGSRREDRHRPRSALHTPRRNPRQQPHHVTVAVAPVPLAAPPLDPTRAHRCRYTPASSARPPRRLRGVAPPPSSDGRRPLPVDGRPVLPWALFPFEVLLADQKTHPSVIRVVRWRRFRRITARATPGSVPHRRSDRALPARPVALAGDVPGATHPRDPKTAAVVAWARHIAVPKDDAAPGDAAPPLPVVDASPRGPGSRTRRARADTRGGRNPFCGSPGNGRKPVLPSLTEARIRGAPPAGADARAPTTARHEPVPKKSVQS
jgi:hypothetical protein